MATEKLHEVDKLSPLERLEEDKDKEIADVVEGAVDEEKDLQQSIDFPNLTLEQMVNKIWEEMPEPGPGTYTNEKNLEYKSHRFLRMGDAKKIEYAGHTYKKIEMKMSKIVDEPWTGNPYEIHVKYKKDGELRPKDFFLRKGEKDGKVVVYFMDNRETPKEYHPYSEEEGENKESEIKVTLTTVYVLMQKIKSKKQKKGT